MLYCMMKYVSLLAIAIGFLVWNSTDVHAQMMDDCAAHPDDELMHDEHCAVFALVPADGATHKLRLRSSIEAAWVTWDARGGVD